MSDEVDEIVAAAELRRRTLRELRDAIVAENRVKSWAWSTFKAVAGWLIKIAPELIPYAVRFLQGEDVDVRDVVEEALPDVDAVLELIEGVDGD